MIKVFVHDFNSLNSTLEGFQRQVNDCLLKLEHNDAVDSYSTEMFFDQGRLVFVISIDFKEAST